MLVGWADVIRELVIVERSGEKLDAVLKSEARHEEIGGRVELDNYGARVISEVKTDQPQTNYTTTKPEGGGKELSAHAFNMSCALTDPSSASHQIRCQQMG
jgi:hypothetical protein